MASTIILKRRINSIKSTRQITKAMELVSASKLRRAQNLALISRDYQRLSYEFLQRLSVLPDAKNHPMLSHQKVLRQLYVIITSNSGLAGAYNANVDKVLVNRLRLDKEQKIASSVIVVGNKGASFVRRLQDVKLEAVFQPFGEKPTADSLRPLLNMVIDKYQSGEVQSIELIYTSFKTIVSQKVEDMSLLPVASVDQTQNFPTTTTLEPDAETVISQVVVRLIEAQLFQAVLESLASEHAMRMVATKNATDNANELIDDYTLELNTARQAAITQELAEITGGAEALS